MRGRIWVFAALVAAALVLHLALLSAKVAQNGEDSVRAHVALATNALRAQLELLDARLAPRAVASVPDLVEATRPPADPAQALSRPDERALRAAASALSPEPDLVAVVNGQGAIVSRRGKAAQALDDAAPLPLAKAALEGSPAPAFATWSGSAWRVAAARIPGNGAAALVGTLVDDRFAAQLKSQVDADVTLLQGGKVLASSLPQGEQRARLLRWAAAPAPGYGVLQIWLPGVDNALSGKLPRGASRYAVRGALLQLDSGVQAALTVPAGPYFAWLGRYQAFYLVGLALFVLFSLFWGLLARPAPAARVEAPAPGLPAPAALPSLLGTDVGEPRTAPPPSGDVPWPKSEPAHGEPPAPEVARPRPAEALDAGLLAAGEPSAEGVEHPMWSADPFMPTPGQFATQHEPEPGPQEMTAEEAGLKEAEPDLPASPEAPEEPAAAQPAKSDFSFAGLLDEGQGAPPPHDEPEPRAEPGADEARPGDLGQQKEPFPGDEPTRIEPVSAALLDKLRERDEELQAAARPAAPAAPGWGSLVPEGDALERTAESAPPPMEPPAPQPEANVTLQDFSMPAVAGEDPDEQHWRETFDQFRAKKEELGEPADRITFEKFAAKLRKNRTDLMAKHRCKGVRFSVYAKDGKAAIKATVIR